MSTGRLSPPAPPPRTPVRVQESEDLPLTFDPTRCAECISIGGHSTTVRQVVDKTWGVVITSSGFAPNTGVHAWDVKLKQADKGCVCGID